MEPMSILRAVHTTEAPPSTMIVRPVM